jgi:hypothetical protein
MEFVIIFLLVLCLVCSWFFYLLGKSVGSMECITRELENILRNSKTHPRELKMIATYKKEKTG